MNKFNIESAKFLSIIIVICFVFIMVVWKAFDYLPSSYAEKIQAQAETFVEEEQVNEEQLNEEQPSEENLQEEEARMRAEHEAMLREIEERRRMESARENLKPLENIEEVIPEEKEEISFTNMINIAQSSMIGQNYSGSISEYKKAMDLANSPEEKALCYEGIANVYALQKRYGSALAAAQSAYNSYPNTAREVLLARLYYKTGDINRANARMSNVLKRDFMSNDR